MTSRASRLGWLVALPIAFAAFAGLAGPAKALTPSPRLAVTGASLIDAATGQQLYGVHAGAELPIASTTKLMTALVTLQHVHHLGTVFAQNAWTAAPSDSQIGLDPGERMSVHDLLLALLLPSADDAAEDLAYNVGHGSVARFVAMMNADARALHLTRTHYTTPIGLDTPGNYSSPRDLDTLATYLLDHSPYFRRVVALRSAVLLSGNYRRTIYNRNDLVARFAWINGVKTGHTSDAGYVLVASGTRDGMTLIGSVLGTDSIAARDSGALALLDYGFSAFRAVEPIRSDQVIARLPIRDSSARARVIASRTVKRAVPRADHVYVRARLPRQLAGPLRRHAVVGEAEVVIGRRTVATVPLILARAIPAVSATAKAIHFLARPFTLVVVILACGAGLAVGESRRRRGRRGALRRERRRAVSGHVEEG